VSSSQASVSAIALLREWSKDTVRRCQVGVALAIFNIQLHLLSFIPRLLRLKPPKWASATMMWDETGERVSLIACNNQIEGIQANQASSTWQVMVVQASGLFPTEPFK